MRCARCGGLMVREQFEDLGGLGSSDHEYAGWRCLNCGAIVDPMIDAHRRITSSAVASIQTLATVYGVPSPWADRSADHRTVPNRRVRP